MEYITIIVGIIALLIGAIGSYLIARIRTVASETLLEERNAECNKLKEDIARANIANAATLSERNDTITSLRAENARLSEQIRQQDDERKSLRRESELIFREIANSIFDEKSKVLRDNNSAQLGEILTPFKSDLENLKKTIHDCYTGEVSEVKSLRDSIKDLTELNTTIGREAKELSTALRGNNKIQGDWGEMLLKQILEKSGLEEGIAYTLQATENEDGTKIKGDDNNQLRPDAIIHLPDGKNIVIDSKTVITAYTNYINAPLEEQKAALDAHLRSIKSQVDELAKKQYHRHIKGAADFVLMFIPNEGAYLAALNADKDLWESAYNRHIVIISPTHLISVLKLMYQLWTRDKQTKNALLIAEETGKLYDKLVGFVEDLESVGKNIDKAMNSYESAYKKLSSGNGNLLTKAQNIKAMGIKTTKQLKIEE